jgi:hypothetical protein
MALQRGEHMTTSSRAILAALAAATFAACDGAAPPLVEETVAAVTAPASTCQTETDTSGPFRLFNTSLTRRVRRAHQPDRIIRIDVAQNSRWFGPSTEQQGLVVSLNGQPLFENYVDRYNFSDEIDISQYYHPPYQGASVAVSSILEGTVYADVDGRNIVPTPASTPPSAIVYDDGLPAPVVTLDPAVQSAMNDLLTATKTAASQCVASDTNVTDPNLIGGPSPLPHQSDTRSNTVCQVCRAGCEAAAGICFYGAATSVACGPFVFFCAVGEIAACTGSELVCLGQLCDKNGGACCAVGCGGEGNANFFGPPASGSSVGCCNAGEQCLNRSNALCCSSGTTPCGDSDCCGSGQACVSNNQGGQLCCDAGGVGCGSACCAAGQTCGTVDGTPTCCKGCTTDAQCGGPIVGGGNVCSNGCCLTIPG